MRYSFGIKFIGIVYDIKVIFTKFSGFFMEKYEYRNLEK